MTLSGDFEIIDMVSYGSTTPPTGIARELAHYFVTDDGTPTGVVLEAWIYDAELGQWVKDPSSALIPTVTVVDFNAADNLSVFNNVPAGQVQRNGSNWGHNAYSTVVPQLDAVGDYFEFDLGNSAFVTGLTNNLSPTAGWSETDVGVYRQSAANLWQRVNGTLNNLGQSTVNGDTVRVELISEPTAGNFVLRTFLNGVQFGLDSNPLAGPFIPIFASGSGSGQITNAEVSTS